MKSKGYTLIEVIIALAILSSITVIAFPKIESSRNEILDRNLEEDTISVVEFLNWSKAYSRNKNIGTIVTTDENKKIILWENGVRKAEYELKSTDKFLVENKYNLELSISRFGLIPGGCTIDIISSSGNKNAITVKVGSGYVSRKEERSNVN